jgi:hypothetical protein
MQYANHRARLGRSRSLSLAGGEIDAKVREIVVRVDEYLVIAVVSDFDNDTCTRIS